MKEPIMFYDKVKKELTPLRVLVLGKIGAGKTTFANRLKELHEGFVVEEPTDYDTPIRAGVNVVVGVPDQEGLDYAMKEEFFTHVFWVDDGTRVAREAGVEYNIKPDFYRMILVDNSLGLDHLHTEVGYCMTMMGIIKLTNEEDDNG